MLYTAVVLALLYDVHGNLPALEAVLADSPADHYLLGGDYALFGGWPAETVARLRELDAMWLRGNGERWTADPGSAPAEDPARGAIAAARDALGDDVVRELGALPEMAVHRRTRYCHASPVSDVRSFLPDAGDDEAELLDGIPEPRLVFGHTHIAFRRTSAATGVVLVNPGSVGIPLDGDPRAAYALVHEDGSIEQRRVGYGHEESAREVRRRFGDAPWTQIIAGRIESAQL
jgi:diadenosine tetraphosphatase ApaH/serine/threonine PP2A family protein phosphatase